jgi:membrane protein YqaA with SNARE-associated domain
MLRRLYNWTLRLAAGPRAALALVLVAFAESSFFPIPPDVILVPMVLANRRRAWWLAALCTLSSTLGGVLGYMIGFLLYDSVGAWLIHLYGYESAMESFRAMYAEWGPWIIVLKGLTPIPYKIVTITAGFAGYNFPLFVVLSLFTRAARFFIVAWLLRRYGEPIRHFIETRLELVTMCLLVMVIGGFVLAKYVI